jgi:hypothetical protein
MLLPNWTNTINKTDILPPMTVRKSVKESKKWQKAVMDAFQFIGREQFIENSKFWDYYRMVEGKMSYQELKHAVPHLEQLSDLLDGAGVPAFLKHYDLLGSIIRDIVGKFVDMQDKFHVIDTGEIAENEFLRYKNQEITKMLNDLIENEVNTYLATQGLTPEGKQFSSPEEQQAFMQQVAAQKQALTPKDTLSDSKSTFKTIGMKWGEATLERDREKMSLNLLSKEELRDKLLTGRCFRHYRVGFDEYVAETWSPKNTFFSKEVDAKFAQDCNYVGRLHFLTPSEVIRRWGPHIKTDDQRKLLAGNPDWKSFLGYGEASGSINQAMGSNFNKPTWVPFEGVQDYNFYLNIQDTFGVPMGESTWFNPDGSETKSDRFLPRYAKHMAYGYHNVYANVLRDDFVHRSDLCEVTEAYFIAEDLYGLLKYENENGMVVTVDVTEDILPDFLRDNNIKQDFKSSIVDITSNQRAYENQEVNTIVWTYRPVTYEGVKITSPNLDKDLYIYCKEQEHQIKGDSEFDRKLPVAGYIGQPFAHKIMPYQAAFNLVMNQIYNMLEKEIGVFFLLDVTLIPSEIDGWGDAQEAMQEMMGLAKDIGILPVQTSGDAQKNANNFNQLTTHNLSYANQIQTRLALANTYKLLAYETLGANPQAAFQPTKYETAEGVRLNNENSTSQIAEIFEEFSEYERNALQLHLSVAQYCQSNRKDNTIMYTKGDASLAFLKLNDPNFPFRRIGLMPSKDSKKRKELETYKQWLIQNNTVGTDELLFAELISSDAMGQLLDVAKKGLARREEQNMMAHERAKELEAMKGQQEQELKRIEFENDMAKTESQNKTKVIVAQLTAQGRAADKNADTQSFDTINATAKTALAEKEIQNTKDFRDKQMSLEKEKQMSQKELDILKLKQKAEELRVKAQMKKDDLTIAAINKN